MILTFVFHVDRKVLELLNIEEDQSDVEALKSENKQMRRSIFEMHEEVRQLQDKLSELREDSI